MTDDEPGPVFPASGAKAPTARGYRPSDYRGTLTEFMDSGERSALVSCDGIRQHATYMGLIHVVETKRLPVRVSKRDDGIHLTRTEANLDVPAPVSPDGDEQSDAIEVAPQAENAPQPEKPSLVGRLKSWVRKR